MPAATWKIGRSTGMCALTEHPLVPGDQVVVGLFEDAGSEGYLRRDHQAEAWQEAYGEQKCQHNDVANVCLQAGLLF